MSESEFEGPPVIRDKRRIDPETGQRREDQPAGGGGVSSDAASAGHRPDDVASPAGDAARAGAAQADAAHTDADGDDQEGEAQAEQDALAKAKEEAADLFDQLQRAKADLYNLDQRFNNYVRRSRQEVEAAKEVAVAEVVEAIIPVMDDIAAAREHEELTGPFGAIAEKLESTLAAQYGVERYGAVGEAFDPEVHEALMHEQSDTASENTISTVLQPGYRAGEKVIRPARVAVTGPQ